MSDYSLSTPRVPESMREQYRVEAIHAVDGDTLAVRLVAFSTIRLDYKVRIQGVDAPEIHDERQRQAAGVAMRAAQYFIDDSIFPCLRVQYHGEDKYSGRIVGDLLRYDSAGRLIATLSKYLLLLNCARHYDCGKKAEWTDEELKYIESISLPLT